MQWEERVFDSRLGPVSPSRQRGLTSSKKSRGVYVCVFPLFIDCILLEVEVG